MPEKITSPQNTKIKSLMRLQKRGDRDHTGLMVIEGVREIGLALRSGIRLTELFYCPDIIEDKSQKRLFNELRERRIAFTEVGVAAFSKIAYREGSGGFVALAERPSPTLADLPETDRPFYVVADALEKPGNLGAILRSADGAGATGLIVTDLGIDLFGSNVIRASLGTVFSVPVAAAPPAEAAAWLKGRNARIITLSPQADTVYTDVDFTKPCAVVFGSESLGASALWMTAAHARVKIPMRGRADSLNVSTSAAIILYEALRQRGDSVRGQGNQV